MCPLKKRLVVSRIPISPGRWCRPPRVLVSAVCSPEKPPASGVQAGWEWSVPSVSQWSERQHHWEGRQDVKWGYRRTNVGGGPGSYPTTTSWPLCSPRPSTLNTTPTSIRGSGLVKVILAAISLPTTASPRGWEEVGGVMVSQHWSITFINDVFVNLPWWWGQGCGAWKRSGWLTPAGSR